MAQSLLCAFVLVALAAVLVEGHNFKMTCNAKKEPNYMGLAGKFSRCLPMASKAGPAAQCISEEIGDKKINCKKSEDWFAAAVPAKAKSFVVAEMKKCEPACAKCKPKSADASGASCVPLKDCVWKFIQNVCKHT